mmetsp:Transcript_86538/g.229813  ORF Transcript_86538/g.229813 Transcript_86538/m.229813 type:complete len:221 (-) Transcript_86538:431-1093(-)
MEALEGEVRAAVAGGAKDGDAARAENLESHADAIHLCWAEEHANLPLLLQVGLALFLRVALLCRLAAEQIAGLRGKRTERQGEHVRQVLPRGEARYKVEERLPKAFALLRCCRGVGIGYEGLDVESKRGNHLRVQVPLPKVVTTGAAMIVGIKLDLGEVEQRALRVLVQAQLEGRVAEGARAPDHLEGACAGVRLQVLRHAVGLLDPGDRVASGKRAALI